MNTQETPTEKACIRCGETKPADQFYKARNNKTGLMGMCKACHFEDTQPKVKAYLKKKYNEDQEFRRKAKDYAHDYYEENREKIKARMAEYYQRKKREKVGMNESNK